MNKFKSALGFYAIEAIGARLFDLIILWIILNSLAESDIANFGLATSALVFFNLIFFGPETALLKNQKEWKMNGEIGRYLSAFIAFSFFKIFIHLIIILFLWLFFGAGHWLLYAAIFSIIAQQILLAEISRIYLRMELQQAYVAKFELISKFFLATGCLILLLEQSLTVYLSIYYAWSLFTAFLLLAKLRKFHDFYFLNIRDSSEAVWRATVSFSIWSHLIGIAAYYIYNSNILFLNLAGTTERELALFTTTNKVINLFFVLPMFFQSFIPVVLANSKTEGDREAFRSILISNGFLSLFQFLFFVICGTWLGSLFGLSNEFQIRKFYELGLLLSFGVLILNLARPLSTYLIITTSPIKVMVKIFLPSVLLATCLYVLGSQKYGLLGSAAGAAISYAFMGFLLWRDFIKTRRAHSLGRNIV